MDETLTTIAQDFNSVQSVLSQYVVTPLNAFGIGGFVFDVDGASIANLNAEVTDHYAEDNSFFQDNIATRPGQYILRGYVGELVDIEDQSNSGPLQTLTQKLTTLTSLLPALSAGATEAQGYLGGDFNLQTITSPQFLSQASSLYSAVQSLLPTTKQQAAFQYFKALWNAKILVSLQTPFEFINNMAILNVAAIQQEDTKYKMDFAVTLKQIRYASTNTALFDPNNILGSLGGGTPASNPEILPPPVASLPQNGSAIGNQTPIVNGSVNGNAISGFPNMSFAPWANQGGF